MSQFKEDRVIPVYVQSFQKVLSLKRIQMYRYLIKQNIMLNYLDEYGGCTDQEIDRAISEYMYRLLNEPQHNYTWGGGDSIDRDREWVRDIIIKNKGVNTNNE